MGLRWRSLFTGGVCCVWLLFLWAACGVTASAETEGGATASTEASFGTTFVISEAPTESEQIQAVGGATFASPEAVAAREESLTKFENLTAEQAVQTAQEAFGKLISEPSGGPPALPQGQRATKFLDANTEDVDLGNGQYGVVQTLAPMAIETGLHQWSAVDLGLSAQPSGFAPTRPLVEVQIPRHLADGVQLPASGITITPVDGQQSPLTGSEGVIAGSSAFFANTMTDTDAFVKPTTSGVSLDTVLRSARSPKQLAYQVALPSNASFASASNGSVHIVKEGTVIGTVAAPRAHDAAGGELPVSMTYTGDILQLTVTEPGGKVQFPIEVDPEFNLGSTTAQNRPVWEFASPTGGFEASEIDARGYLQIRPSGPYVYGQFGDIFFRTNGDSRIYKLYSTTEFNTIGYGVSEFYINGTAEIYAEAEGPGGREGRQTIAAHEVEIALPLTSQGWASELCAQPGCSVETPGDHNLVRLAEVNTGNPSGNSVVVEMTSATSYISQPKSTHSTVTYNTASSEIEYESTGGQLVKTANLAYTNGWVGPHSGGALEYTAKDAGLGVSETATELVLAGKWEKVTSKNFLQEAAVCKSIECGPEQHGFVVPSNYNLANGEDRIRVSAHDAIEHTSSTEFGEGERTLKVDKTAPFGISLTGLPIKGSEMQLGEVTGHLRAQASDGEASVPSAGIKSIALAVDGKEIGTPKGACSVSTGTCTATAEWALNGAELGVGSYVLTVAATDRANNVETKQYTLNVYHATPVAMGPGSVNPESGDFALEATDVNISGGAGELALSRHYDSRNPQEGEEGPFGPQWSGSLGGLATLEVLPDKSVMLFGPEGLTHFSLKAGGGLEAPAGDTNLTLELKGNEYLLKDTAKGTTTRFTQPSGSENWMPTISEGPLATATNTMTDTYRSVEAIDEYAVPSSPWGITSGPAKSLWYTEAWNGVSSVGEITPAGVEKEFTGLPLNNPTGITEGSDGNLWFINSSSRKVDRLTPAGQLTEFESPGNGEWGDIAEGPEGYVWFTHQGGESEYPGSIVKIDTYGQATTYSVPAESNPQHITPGPENDMWFTNRWCAFTSGRVCKIGKISTSGQVTEYPLERWASPHGIVAGPNDEQAVWFPMVGPNAEEAEIVRMSVSGAITKYPLPKGSNPNRITVGADNSMWFTYSNRNKIGKITTSGTITEYSLPENQEALTITSGPDGKLWFTEAGAHQIGTISTSGRIVEPVLELAPHPTAVCTPTKLERGCRGLEFTYASATTAKGENESEWGEYRGRLMKASFVGYNPATKAMETKPVAEYSYDKQGRLRATWDPRLEHALKTRYGYDAYGHITSLTPPGQQPWLFAYGTIEGDLSTGRLLTATRASASTPAGSGYQPVNTTLPALSSTKARVGIPISVSTGTWSSGPISYSYQWETCTGSSCVAIPGATNATYAPPAETTSTLQATVTATNATGATTATSSTRSNVLANATYKQMKAFGLEGSGSGQLKEPSAIAVENYAGSEGNVWVADTGNNRIEKFSSSGAFLAAYGSKGKENGQFEKPVGIALSETDQYLYVSDPGNQRVEVFEAKTGKYLSQLKLGFMLGEKPFGVPAGLTVARFPISPSYASYLCIARPTTEQVSCDGIGANGELQEALTFNTKGKEPTGLAANEDGRALGEGNELFVTNKGSHSVAVFEPYSTGEPRLVSQFGSEGGGEGQFSTPESIAVEPEANTYTALMKEVLASDPGNSRVQMSSTTGVNPYDWNFGAGPQGLAVSTNKARETYAYLYVVSAAASGEKGKVAVWAPGPAPQSSAPEPPNPGKNSVATVEYQVPVNGIGQAYDMANGTVEKWGQKDYPAVATAIFPPDEPMGWPAKDFRRATVYYMDTQARTVNVASPPGAISTHEYNEDGSVTRTLGADNRQTAMNEGCISVAKKECKSAEVSELLDTRSIYNGAGQLTDTRGPQHMVKLASGKEGKAGEEVLARNHVKYFYDEGAPSGETYNLVTKTIDGAETASKEEFDKRTVTTAYRGQSNLGWKLREPTSSTVDPGGLNLTSTTLYEEGTGNVIETQTPAASGKDATVPPAFLAAFGAAGQGAGQLEGPVQEALDSHGDVWVADYGNHRIEEYSPAGAFMQTFGWGVKDGKAEVETCTSSCRQGLSGTGKGQFEGAFGIAINQATNNVYVSDYLANRIQELSPTGASLAAFGSKGAVGGQFSSPGGLTVDTSGNVWVADAANNRIQELSPKGDFLLAVGWGVKDGKAEVETCTSACQAGLAGAGKGQLSTPVGITMSGANVAVADYGNNRIQTFTTAGVWVSQFGSKGTGRAQFEGPTAITSEAATGNLYVVDSANNRVQKLASTGAFIASFGSSGSGNGQLLTPAGVTVSASGEAYVSDHSNNRLERWIPPITGNAGAHDHKTIYYTAGAEAEIAACREHPEWAGLPCQAKPVAQPGTKGLPELPVTTAKYNLWDQPEITIENFGSAERTKTTTYDSAGRPLTSEVTATTIGEGKAETGTPLPKVTDQYNAVNGAVEVQSTTVGETTKTLTRKYNTLGQLESYKDADGNTATFEYEQEKDTRLTKMADTKGTQTYAYNETTGALAEIVDSAAGTFSAAYDVAGKMTSESYPNGMTAYYTRNTAGETTRIEYKKITHCTEKCVWFSDTTISSIHGEPVKQTSALAEQPTYTYDAAGRLLETQEIPAGQGCKTRLYSYDEDSNRTTQTTREPASEGKCASEGGATEWHTYNTADTLADPHVTYDAFGDTTSLPAADAGGKELASEYYVDGQVYKQAQGEQKLEYKLDPEGRTRETITTGTSPSIAVFHYDTTGGALAWTSEGSGETEKWTRNIPGIDGALTAIEKGEGKTPGTMELELHDLSGNIVGTASLSETETKLLTTYNSTEFGVPTTKEAPPKYAWLGATGVASELPSGVITQDGITYVPITGRPLQTEGIALPAPENASTPFTRPVEAWVGSRAGEGAAIGLAAEKQREEEREAANQPPGILPLPEVGEEGGEEGYEESQPGGGGGCTGVKACASSAASCYLHIRFGEPSGNELWAVGEYDCTRRMPRFQIEVCILFDNLNSQRYENLVCNHGNHGSPGQIFKNEASHQVYVSHDCNTGIGYRGWVWGYTFGAGPRFHGKETAILHCNGHETVDNFFEAIEYAFS